MKHLILNILSILIGLVGVIQAVRLLRRQMVAEKELSNRLKNRVGELFKSLDSSQLHTFHIANSNINIDIDENDLKKLIAEVKQVVEELPKNKRSEILDPLEQKSSKGRLN